MSRHTNDNPAALSAEALAQVMRDYLGVTQRLQDTHESLQREVTRLRTELESKDRELERRRRLASLGELAAGVAHEVRNPLGAIQLYSELLKRECGRLAPALALIEKIEDGVRAIDGVVQDTLALAPRGCKLRRCDVRRLAGEIEEHCRVALETRGIRLETLAGPRELHVQADEDALRRVLINLVTNAAEASPPGARVQLTAERAGAHVEITVLDSGPGLAPELLDKIFDPFFTTKPRGTGLGLTIAHRLVEAHGGELRADNRPEGGARFAVRLPLADETERSGRPAALEFSAA
jgi:signal transduction histidine kinase